MRGRRRQELHTHRPVPLLSTGIWMVLGGAVVPGVRTFVPIMLKQDAEGHIVNTASLAGLASYHSDGIYKVTKHGIVTLSETLCHELAQQEAKIKVSVLCPAFVRTQIMDAERNRPVALQNPPKEEPPSPEDVMRYQAWYQAVQEGMPPQQVADCVFQAIRDEKFYILTHPETKPLIQLRMEDILHERNPTDALAGRGL
jgi:short-subunit dehydrogenase